MKIIERTALRGSLSIAATQTSSLGCRPCFLLTIMLLAGFCFCLEQGGNLLIAHSLIVPGDK
jgi:hypothetical protein